MASATRDGITKLSVLLRTNRRASTALQDQHRHERHDSIVDADESCLALPATHAQDETKLTFFDLPPELRNVIYNIVASQTVLKLSATRRPSSSHPPQRRELIAAALIQTAAQKRVTMARKEQPDVIGLLLASKQCRREYLPVVYSTASIIVNVTDFDFRNIIRVAGSLYRSELKALRENKGLFIHLSTHNCAREHLLLLRRWLNNRAGSLDRLPWRYTAPLASPPNVVGRIRQLREMEYYTRKLAELHSKLDENSRWELQNIVMAFNEQISALENHLQHLNMQTPSSRRSDLRGLAGGGVM